MENPKSVPGDYVEVHLLHLIYEGVLLENPETGIVLLKLDSGYNIGFHQKDILKIELIKKAKGEEHETRARLVSHVGPLVADISRLRRHKSEGRNRAGRECGCGAG